jgi:ribose transport system permease protein
MKNEISTAEAMAGLPAGIKQSERAAKFLDLLKRRGIWAIILVCVITLTLMEPRFINPRNLINILLQASIYGVMAIGMTFLMINGYFDLSVGTVMGLCASLAVGLQSINLFVAVAVSLLVGLTFGMINGFLVTRAGINAFIVTLASMFGARGLVFVYTKEQAIVGTVREFGLFGASRIGFMPTLALIFIVLLVIAELFLRFSVHGRNTYAIGGNYEAASNAGINVKRTIFINFALTGLPQPWEGFCWRHG